MKDDKIPDNDNIARFCRPSQAPEGQIQATAFLLREGEEKLSVNWLEILKCSNRNSEIGRLREIYSQTFTVGARARIAILNVGRIRKTVRMETPDKRNLEVLHDPQINDLSHSGIYNMQKDNMLIAELILETVTESYSARKKR